MTNSFLRNILICCTILFIVTGVQAQFSKTHYIPPISAFDHSNSLPQDQYLYISTPSTTPVNFKIIPIGGTTINATTSKTSPYRYSIGSGENTQLFVEDHLTNRIYNNKGYVIEADDLVYVTMKLNGSTSNAQAGALVSKGKAGLGTEFRTGGFYNPRITEASMNFISVMATENNTNVTISNLPNGISYIANGGKGNADISITLNNGESYIVAAKNSATSATQVNSDAFLGALVTSDKLISVNCGSLNGTNADANPRDYGFDQIVPTDRIGNEYIFTRAFGTDDMENPIIVAHEDNTDIYVDGDNTTGTFIATINAGEYFPIQGDKYSTNSVGGNLYVWTSKNVFAYQGVGGTTSAANQGLFFTPPLNCETPIIVDNIPLIDEIGGRIFQGGLSILTKTNATVSVNGSTILKNNTNNYSTVKGKTDYATYLIEGLSGNVTVESTDEVYVAAFGYNGAASFGGYYSGFSIKPEVFFDSSLSSDGCLPGVKLGLNTLTSFDEFQWYKDSNLIPGETNNTYAPTEPGYYYVKGKILCNGRELDSDEIPVSNCTELDNFDIPVNMDLDYDNDGILNCTESLGEFPFDLSNASGGNFISGEYTYDYNVSTENTSAITPFIGTNEGNLSMEVPSGVTNSVVYESKFNKPLNIKIQYPETSISNNSEFTSEEFFTINVPIDKTITIYDPDNQLLIDTNYDGIYESNVGTFSAFEVRIKSNAPSLSFGTGTFSISAYQVDSIKITLTNNSDFNANKASLQLLTSCIPLDSDNDTIPDYLDLDSDNDGIPDLVEAQGKIITPATTDTNKDGLFDAFETTSQNIIDTDNDGILDYLDLDSDNDGIYDLEESNSGAPDNVSSPDGIIDGASGLFGANGLFNNIETAADNGILNYTINDSDNDTNPNSVEVDADGDACFDVIEAGFTDNNGNGFLGNGTPIVNTNGTVISGTDGYTNPHPNYTIGAPIIITDQPSNSIVCEFESTSFKISTNVSNIQWQYSSDRTIWNDVVDSAIFSGTNTNTLNIDNAPTGINNNLFRAVLSEPGNSCGLISDEVILTVDKNSSSIVFGPVGPFCLSDDEVALVATPSGGKFTGDGITNEDTGEFNPTNASAGDHVITYTLTNSNNCTVSKSITITVNAIPDPAIVNSIQTFCSSDLTTITIADLTVNNQGANSLNWYNSETGGSKLNTNTQVEHNQVYYAELENDKGCVSDIRTETTVFLSSPNITASNEGICFGEETTLTVNGVPETPQDFRNAHPELSYITNYKNSHYFIKKESISWEAANTIGDNLPGASMYIINDTAEETAVYNALQSQGLTGNDGISYWFGLKQINTASDFSEPSGGWYWTDGTPLTYSNWNTFEPNDFPDNSVDNEENYAQFEFNDNGKKWNDAINNSDDRNSYPLFEFTGTTDVVWGYYDNIGNEVTFPETSSSLKVNPTETTTYFIKVTTNGVECKDEITVTVNPLPILTVTIPEPICQNADPIQLKISPNSGTFSGPGVSTTGIFTPADANIGANTISYEYADEKGCTATHELSILVYEVPPIIFTPQSPICENANTVKLNATPTGGIYSGTGVTTEGVFDPTIALEGTHEITYTFVTDDACTSIGTLNIVVNPEPEIVFDPITEICINADAVQLNATPVNGTFSGTGISESGLFNPSAAGEGIHPITYSYTDSNSCTSDKTVNITVNKLGVVTITPVAPICIDAEIQKLNASPIGGTFSGNGINTDGDFDPSLAGLGTHTITYEYIDGNNCSASNTIEITVNDLPVIVFAEIDELCIDAPDVQLNATPTGGTYSGSGVSNTGLFAPNLAGVGTHIISYEYTDGNGCTNSKTIEVKINPLPIVSLQTVAPFCLNDKEIQLTATPIGGTFSGIGVSSSGIFNPALATEGSHTITYNYQDANGCNNSDSITIIVHPLPELTFDQPAPFCFDSSEMQLIVSPLGGSFAGSGTTNTGMFNPADAGVGTHNVSYSYSDANGCTNTISVDIIVNAIPELNVNDSPLCIGDFIELTNLSNVATGTITTYFNTFNDAELNSNQIIDTNVNPSVSRSYFAKATNPITGCTDIKEIKIQVVDLPTLTPVSILQCDDESSDGFTFFNLRIKENEISTNSATETFTYYKTKTAAETKDDSQKIDIPIAYQNEIINADTIWVRVENAYDCWQVTQIDLAVSTTDINKDFQISYEACDDFLDINGDNNTNNSDTDGVTLFNFNDATAQFEALIPAGQKPIVTFYRNEADGLAEIDPIDPSNYRNIGYPNEQYIYVRIDSDINDGCYGFGPHIKLTVASVPVYNPVIDYELCDDDTDGYSSKFDLSTKTSDILGDQNNVTLSYHRSYEDATTGDNALPTIFTNEIRDKQTIYIRLVNNTTGCINPHGTFDIVVNALPSVETIPTYEVCEDEILDGFTTAFDLDSKIQDLLGASQSSVDFNVSFHRTSAEAIDNSNPIISDTYQNEKAWNQTLYVRIENKTTGCINNNGTLELQVNTKPEFTVEEKQIVCIDNPNGLDLMVVDPLGTYDYEWLDSAGNTLGNGESFKVFQKGIYTVVATIAASPDCPTSKEIIVEESSAPTVVDFKITDGKNLGSILVFVDGIGDYEYQLNDGDFEENPLFENLSTGTHSITVKDKNGCGTDTLLDVTILVFNKYFSPNGDLVNDSWGIGIDPSKYKLGEIKIFDRSGRLLKIINPLATDPNLNSWNGTFNGKKMPATDYWFSLELTDNNGKTVVKTGNFSLIF